MKKNPKNWRPTVLDLVEIRFMDHSDSSHELEFLVWGRISKVTKNVYVVDSWAYPHKRGAKGDDNVIRNAIVRRAIREITRLHT